jgi:hypothetical protein
MLRCRIFPIRDVQNRAARFRFKTQLAGAKKTLHGPVGIAESLPVKLRREAKDCLEQASRSPIDQEEWQLLAEDLIMVAISLEQIAGLRTAGRGGFRGRPTSPKSRKISRTTL